MFYEEVKILGNLFLLIENRSVSCIIKNKILYQSTTKYNIVLQCVPKKGGVEEGLGTGPGWKRPGWGSSSPLSVGASSFPHL